MCKRNGIADTNQCQFYVTLGSPLTFLDNECVLFGRIVQGFRVFKLIDKLETINEIPHPPVSIEECGDYKIEQKKLVPKNK
jgi:cyclophilin family peptidyl-prolyl cis-trans isomerase